MNPLDNRKHFDSPLRGKMSRDISMITLSIKGKIS